ncbi:PAS domain S-box protein [Thermodesulfobacteriota bacterium]
MAEKPTFKELEQADNERKRAEKELRQYESMVASSKDMIALLNTEFTHLATNAAYVSAFGKTKNEVIGRTVDEVFGKEFFESVIKPHADRCLSGEETHYSDWFDFPVSGRCYMDISYFPYLEKDKETRGFVVYGRDITERKQAEEALRKSEENLAKAQQVAHIGSWSWDVADSKIFWSDEMYSIHELNRESEPSVDYVRSIIHVDDLKIIDDAIIKTDKSNPPPEFMDYRIVLSENKIKWLRATAELLFDDRGDVSQMFGTVQDITDRKRAEEALRKSEERFRSLSESSPMGVFHTDSEGRVLYTNNRWQEITGLTLEESLGFGWSNALHPDNKKALLEEWGRCLSEEKGYSGEFRFVSKSEEVKWVYTKTAPIRAETGQIIGHVGSNEDITQRKKAEEELLEQKSVLEKKNIAFSEVLEQIQVEKRRIKDDVATNVRELLLPMLMKLKTASTNPKYIDLLQHHLVELASSFGREITERTPGLTSREIEISNMVKSGLTSKEIADLLNISHKTVEKHRRNIRSKLGISNKKINLSSFLQRL